MLKLQAFKFKLRPTREQREKIRQFAGCRRFVYNKGLALQKQSRDAGEKHLAYPELCKYLTQWRHAEDTSFLSSAPTHPLQQALKDLDTAFKNFFASRASFPKFKKKSRSESFRYPDPKQIKIDEKNSRIFLPNLGWIRYRKSRAIVGTVKQVTVTGSSDDWYVSVQTEREEEVPPRIGTVVGIDLGIAQFATMSDGTQVAPVSMYRRKQKRLRKEQRKLRRKMKFGANWRKQVKRIQKLHEFISSSRKDFQHKVSTAISKNHAVVIVEDLNVKGMSTSASKTVEKPGKNVKAKSGLNKSILDQGWAEFRRQLAYKLPWTGGRQSTAGMYSNRGSAQLLLGQMEPALKDFNMALEKDANSWPARLMRLTVYQTKGENEKIVEDSSILLASASLPKVARAEVFSHRGFAQVKLEKYKEAIEDLTKAMEGLRGRDKGRAAYARSVAYYKIGDKEKANQDLELAAELKGIVSNRTPDKPVDATEDLQKALKPLIEKARASYPEAKKRFNTLPNGYHFEVMTDIFDADKKHGERVFVQVDKMVDRESGNVVYGRLGSQVQLKDHKFGEELEVKEADILDWTIVSPDGAEEGNLIGKFLDNWRGGKPSQ